MRKLIIFIGFCAVASVSSVSAQTNSTDYLTITTYYPSPYGVYRNLRIHPGNEPTAGVDRGLLYYNNTDNNLKLYTNAGWINLGGGYWQLNETTQSINNTNTGNIFIGATSKYDPATNFKLEVKGGDGIMAYGNEAMVYLGDNGQTPHIELRQFPGSTSPNKYPYIDFDNGVPTPSNYDARIVLYSNDQLVIQGADLQVQGKIGMDDTSGAGSKMIYDVSEVMPLAAPVDEGEVVVLDPAQDRQVRLSWSPYDKLVVGVVSSSSESARSRAMILVGDKEAIQKKTGQEHEFISIAGQVEVKVCLENGPIAPGDLLVTSSTPGYAMKGTDTDKMMGAVVAKAMEHFSEKSPGGKEGKGKIIALIALQ